MKLSEIDCTVLRFGPESLVHENIETVDNAQFTGTPF